MLPAPPPLAPYLGKTMGQICPFSIGKINTQNHCAHFVGHVMEYEAFAETCKNYTAADKQIPGKGAVIRVDDIFNSSPEKGSWNQRPLRLTSCLIFATISSNINRSGQQLTMLKSPRKHIGIFANGVVWHYSNTQDKVVNDQELMFVKKFQHAYLTAGRTVEFFYGRFLK